MERVGAGRGRVKVIRVRVRVRGLTQHMAASPAPTSCSSAARGPSGRSGTAQRGRVLETPSDEETPHLAVRTIGVIGRLGRDERAAGRMASGVFGTSDNAERAEVQCLWRVCLAERS